ncbi:unnamed protein product [Moneuplotes crassus]|uniref:Uncharacterized protein n=1 Tax=Euplotes crassus TaxID=5936 RepID=A0AAD2CZ43_EUPCR|nr:unnamed protein product [Moneuplotes crassus]
MNIESRNRIEPISPQRMHASTLPPSYSLIDTESSLKKYANYLKIFGWILMVTGILQILGRIGGLDDDYDLYVDYDDLVVKEGDLKMSSTAQGICTFLDIVSGILLVLIGWMSLKTSKDPTRGNTWSLVLKVVAIVLVKMVLILLTFLTVSYSYSKAYVEWVQENEDMFEGWVSDNRTSADNFGNMSEKDEERFEQIFTTGFTIFFSIIFSFCFLCCCILSCSSCMIGFTYKLHSKSKEVDLLHQGAEMNLANPRQYDMRLLQSEASNNSAPYNPGIQSNRGSLIGGGELPTRLQNDPSNNML